MSSPNFIHLKTPNNINKTNFDSKYNNGFNPSKRLKNTFYQSPGLFSKKKFIFPKPSIYHSFINSSAPFNYYKNPVEKNAFLICYNGGPQSQIHSFITIKDLKKESNNKKIIYNLKPCGCLSRQPVTKLSKNLTYAENYGYNKEINRKKNNTFKRINYLTKKPLFRNARNSCGFLTSNKTLMMKKDGNMIRSMKQFNDENNYENRKDFRREKAFDRFQNSKYYENKGEKDKKIRNRINSSCYGFRPRYNNLFHKSQIFNHCKPFLVDEFNEFPD